MDAAVCDAEWPVFRESVGIDEEDLVVNEKLKRRLRTGKVVPGDDDDRNDSGAGEVDGGNASREI